MLPAGIWRDGTPLRQLLDSIGCYAQQRNASLPPVIVDSRKVLRRSSATQVEYPYSDGIALAESPRHFDAILNAMAVLRNRFAHTRLVQVGASMNLFYEEGYRTKKLVPDLFVVRGLEALPEPSYRTWEEGKAPDFVLEVASPSNQERDRGDKQVLYASMGGEEYWRFNPLGALDGATVEGARQKGSALQGLGYDPLERGEDGSICGAVLGLEVRADKRRGMEHLLRFRDPVTGDDLRTFRQSEQGRTDAERQLRREVEARCDLERALTEAERALGAEVALRRTAEAEDALLKARIAGLPANSKPGGNASGP